MVVEEDGTISWRDMTTNKEVLQAVSLHEKISLMALIWRRKKNCIGHIREVIDGQMIRTIQRIRNRLGMLDEFLKELLYAGLKIKAENMKQWRIWKPRTCLTAKTLTTTKIVVCIILHVARVKQRNYHTEIIRKVLPAIFYMYL